jgi:hypothetical protein
VKKSGFQVKRYLSQRHISRKPMNEIAALTQCLAPYVSSTSLRQLRHIVLALLCVTGRITMLGLSRWTERGGSYRTVQRWFQTPLEKDIANLKGALEGSDAADGFMNAASPGVIAVFQLNQYYPDDDAYMQALADVMKIEYERITESGLILQVDCPDLAMGRHIRFRDDDTETFKRGAAAGGGAELRAGKCPRRPRSDASVLGQL